MANWIIWGLANWFNDLRLINWLTDWLYSQDTDQLTESFMADWLTDLLTLLSKDWATDERFQANWIVCPGTDQITECFMADWLTE